MFEDYENIDEIENNYFNISNDEKYISLKDTNSDGSKNKVWTEKDTIDQETKQMADLLGFNNEENKNVKKEIIISENKLKTQEKIPEILFERRKYKGKKKKR